MKKRNHFYFSVLCFKVIEKKYKICLSSVKEASGPCVLVSVLTLSEKSDCGRNAAWGFPVNKIAMKM